MPMHPQDARTLVTMSEAIRKRIKTWMKDNKNYTHEDAKDFIEELTTEFRDEIFEYKKLK